MKHRMTTPLDSGGNGIDRTLDQRQSIQRLAGSRVVVGAAECPRLHVIRAMLCHSGTHFGQCLVLGLVGVDNVPALSIPEFSKHNA